MIGYGDHKPAVVTTPNEYEMRKSSDLQVKFNESVSYAISDHAIKIDFLYQQLRDTQAFMEWVGNTHADVFEQYHAIKDIERVSNG